MASYTLDKKTMVIMVVILILLGAAVFMAGFFGGLLVREAEKQPNTQGIEQRIESVNKKLDEMDKMCVPVESEEQNTQVSNLVSGSQTQTQSQPRQSGQAHKQTSRDAAAQARPVETAEQTADGQAAERADSGPEAAAAKTPDDARQTTEAGDESAAAGAPDDAKQTAEAGGEEGEEEGEKEKYSLQTGMYMVRAKAEEKVAQLREYGYSPIVVDMEDANGRMWHVVRVGGFKDRAAAQGAADELAAEGVGAVVVAEETKKPEGPKTMYAPQVASLLSLTKARESVQRLVDDGYDKALCLKLYGDDVTWYVIYLGAFDSREKAVEISDAYREKRGGNSIVKEYESTFIEKRKACPAEE